MISDVPKGLTWEMIRKTSPEIRGGKTLSLMQDGGGVAREKALSTRPIAFQNDPIGTQISPFRDRYCQPTGLGCGYGFLVIKSLLAQQHQVTDCLLIKEGFYPGPPSIWLGGEIHAARAAPKQPIPQIQVDPKNLMAKAAQTGCDFRKKGRYGPLQKQKATLARRGFIEALHS
jgi:hypothetical protein